MNINVGFSRFHRERYKVQFMYNMKVDFCNFVYIIVHIDDSYALPDGPIIINMHRTLDYDSRELEGKQHST
ncbi:hypothetical protein Hanom_Chr08g00699091 [Helianthus anomalus]